LRFSNKVGERWTGKASFPPYWKWGGRGLTTNSVLKDSRGGEVSKKKLVTGVNVLRFKPKLEKRKGGPKGNVSIKKRVKTESFLGGKGIAQFEKKGPSLPRMQGGSGRKNEKRGASKRSRWGIVLGGSVGKKDCR